MTNLLVVFLLFLVSFILPLNLCGQVQNSKIDVLHYKINLDLTQADKKTLQGKTIIDFQPVDAGVKEVNLELYDLIVDSVECEGAEIKSFELKDNKLNIYFQNPLGMSPSYSLTVKYHGTPGQDPKGFGGFFFKNGYSFNIGVTMSIFPHNAGKMWFPCIDNFTDKATYSYAIRTPKDQKAVCGGTLEKIDTSGNGDLIHHWKFRDQIPTYLASVACGKYEMVADSFAGKKGMIPIQIYVYPSQVNNTKGAFQNLKKALTAFEKLYGPYVWERVGYVSVPFLYGAMEHACNIAYPDATINGNTQYETLMAHELSHAWFGNLVTCEEAGDMWLNEGFARYSEALFLEQIYNHQKAKEYMRELHAQTLKTAHHYDQGYYALSNVPNTITYGKTVYEKGASVAHSLRNTIGDSLFFDALKIYFKDHAFANINSSQFKDVLSSLTKTDLTNFFDSWVFSKGYLHFGIDSFLVTPSGREYNVKIFLKQSMLEKPNLNFANGQPIEIGFLNDAYLYTTQTFNVTSNSQILETQLTFDPTLVFVDPNEKLCDATVDHIEKIRGVNRVQYKDEDATLEISKNPDSAWVRITNNFIAPSYEDLAPELLTSKIQLSNHFWTVEGITHPDFMAKLRFQYQGDPEEGFDNPWMTGKYFSTEDSIILLYRPNKYVKWQIAEDFQLSIGSGGNEDLKGNILSDTYQNGEYTLAYKPNFTSITNKKELQSAVLFPNPAFKGSSPLTLFIPDHIITEKEPTYIEIFGINGQKLSEQALNSSNLNNYQIKTTNLNTGWYQLRVNNSKGIVSIHRFCILP